MADYPRALIAHELEERRSRLANALTSAPDEPRLNRLIEEVDEAIARLGDESFGLCEECHEPIEAERLIADPLMRFCLDHLTSVQQRALEQDLALASEIQTGLLPPNSLEAAGWQTAYHYEGAGPVSGDYCDILVSGADLYFMVGDVSGKGVAAAMLMAHLHATLRSLVSQGLDLREIVARASRMFCESSLPSHFATLVCGRCNPAGDVEICNAGHNHPLIVRESSIDGVASTGLPLGMFCEEEFKSHNTVLTPGELVLLFTDGVPESTNSLGEEYGPDRISELALAGRTLPAAALVTRLAEAVGAFREGAAGTDDLTIMAIRRTLPPDGHPG